MRGTIQTQKCTCDHAALDGDAGVSGEYICVPHGCTHDRSQGFTTTSATTRNLQALNVAFRPACNVTVEMRSQTKPGRQEAAAAVGHDGACCEDELPSYARPTR